jgi:hypothetical protein
MVVTVGMDTHSDVHIAAALDQAGRLLGIASFPASTRGYAQLATWAESLGTVGKVGMEGTGSFGAGCCGSSPITAWRWLRLTGLTIPLGAATASATHSMPSPRPAWSRPEELRAGRRVVMPSLKRYIAREVYPRPAEPCESRRAAAVRRSAGCSHLRFSARWLRPWRSPRRLACPSMT